MGLMRELFGPSQDEIWSQLSREMGGAFEDHFFGSSKVMLSHREWVITLDTHAVNAGKTTVIYTRLRAPYVNPDGQRFTIYRKGVFSWLGRVLGVQDIEIGDPFFDEDFIIQGTSDGFVKHLLANPRIRELIEQQPDVHLEVKDDEGWFGTAFPEGVDELYFQAFGVIKDPERLRQLFDLFALVLDELCRLGSAYEGEPGVRLT